MRTLAPTPGESMQVSVACWFEFVHSIPPSPRNDTPPQEEQLQPGTRSFTWERSVHSLLSWQCHWQNNASFPVAQLPFPNFWIPYSQIKSSPSKKTNKRKCGDQHRIKSQSLLRVFVFISDTMKQSIRHGPAGQRRPAGQIAPQMSGGGCGDILWSDNEQQDVRWWWPAQPQIPPSSLVLEQAG